MKNMKKLMPVILLTFVNVLGFSILIPILPFIVEEYGGNEIIYGLLLSSYSAFQFIGAPLLGELSDRMGRKPILMMSQLGTLLSWVIFGAAYFLPSLPWWGMAMPLWVIFFSRIIDGVTGGNISVANAYLSDITSPAEKAKNFGILGATFGVGIIIGPALGGMAAGTSWGWFGTVILATLISVVTLISIWKFLPESLPPDDRKENQPLCFWCELNLWRKIRAFRQSPFILSMFQFRGILSMALSGYTSIIVLYLMDTFHFDQQEVGIFLLAVGLFSIFNQLAVVPRMVRKFGEIKTLLVGQVFLGTGLFVMTIPSHIGWYIACYYLANLGVTVSMPTIQALLTNNVNRKRQGEVTGVDQSIDALMRTFMPALAGWFYFMIGAKTFWIFASIVIVAFLFFLIKKPQKPI